MAIQDSKDSQEMLVCQAMVALDLRDQQESQALRDAEEIKAPKASLDAPVWLET